MARGRVGAIVSGTFPDGWEEEMTAAELEALEAPETEFETIRSWRLEELLRAGYEEEDAIEIAFHLDIDLHFASALLRQGCASRTAARIVL